MDLLVTEPASPIIEELQPIQQGLNISWKSDVTSRQDKYAVVYNRNDTGKNYNTLLGKNLSLLYKKNVKSANNECHLFYDQKVT